MKTVLFEPGEIIESVHFLLDRGQCSRERRPVQVTNS